MTFDDGIVNIYQLVAVSKKGDKPAYDEVYKTSHYFKYENLGLTRYYTALKNGQKIEAVIDIHENKNIETNDIVEFENGKKFEIVLIQHEYDEDGLKISRLSLEKINEHKRKTKNS